MKTLKEKIKQYDKINVAGCLTEIDEVFGHNIKLETPIKNNAKPKEVIE